MALRSSPLTPQFSWNQKAGRYVNSGGQFVSRQAVRSALDDYLDAKAQHVRQLAVSLRDREISIGDFQREMQSTLGKTHLASAAAAKGGWAQMDQSDYGRVGGLVRPQYRYLEKFAAQIEAGLPLDGRFMRRAMMYADAGRGTYHIVDALEQVARGMTEERSILHARDSCSGCLGEAARGWVPIGEIVPIGRRICLSNCRCTMIFR